MEGNKKPLMGVVVNCMNLNIRKDPTQASRSLGHHRLGYSCERYATMSLSLVSIK